ncbi:MAG: 6-carboxytetrahydropterin synthase, partial [Bryobacterales bacterium]|nr:6-carboxytetrahydropterin synthase [Bryobacterales bacterium]
GHNYKIQVTVQGEELDSIGLLVDFVDVKRLLHATSEYLDHRFINDLPPFDVINPSAENMAKYFYDGINAGLAAERGVRLSEVKVWETDVTYAAYRP